MFRNFTIILHSQVEKDELIDNVQHQIPDPASFHPEFANFSYSPRGIPEAETVQVRVVTKMSVLPKLFDSQGTANRQCSGKLKLPLISLHFTILAMFFENFP